MTLQKYSFFQLCKQKIEKKFVCFCKLLIVRWIFFILQDLFSRFLALLSEKFLYLPLQQLNFYAMRLLLISNSTNFGENYLAWASTQIELFCLQNHINKDSRIIFIPFAGVNIGGMVYPESYDAYEAKVRNVFREKFGLESFTSVHHFDDKVKAVNEADCIVVGGGNTFHLVAEMHRYGLMEAIRNRALAGVPYMGWSAGSNVACPTLCTTNDMPIVQPASFQCLNLVPFQINPHYLDPHPEIDKMIKHGGETRQDRINEYLAVNQNITVVGLREATALWVTDGKMLLKGGKKMIVMRYGKESVEIDPNSDVTFLLGGQNA